MIKYKLSRNIDIESLDSDDNTPVAFTDGYYVLVDEARNKEFLINETIKLFLDKFSVPKSEADVLKELEEETRTATKEMEETCSAFFQFLCKKKILVPEDKEELPANKQPLYKQGEHIDDLNILEVISNKRDVDIYKACDEITGTPCVIKLLNREKIGNQNRYEKELSNAEREYTLLQHVKHIPSISKAYTFNKDHNEFAYITLEYIDGKPLTRFLSETATLSKADCLKVIEEIITAFSLLHQSRLIHGDIHPSNILVLKDATIKIIDLGLSRNVQVEDNEVVKIGGISFYMPPERINTTSVKKYMKEPDLFSDVYQVGVMLYLILYNTTPFKGFIWEELSHNIKTTEAVFPDVSFLNYSVPPSLIDIVQKCMNKDPLKRYVDASELLADYSKHDFK
jgi:tRNA A-37 threonylcarbamoyl transferase component Bud32